MNPARMIVIESDDEKSDFSKDRIDDPEEFEVKSENIDEENHSGHSNL